MNANASDPGTSSPATPAPAAPDPSASDPATSDPGAPDPATPDPNAPNPTTPAPPSPAWDATVWDERYRHARAGTNTRLWSAQPARIVTDTVSAWPPGRALDLATGDGRTAIWLAEHGWSVTGVDFSAGAIELARTHAADRGIEVAWLVADATSWAPGERFDLVTITYLHLPEAELRQVLARAVGWVAPGGHLLVLGHDRANLGTGAPGPSDPDVLYSPELLRSIVGGVGTAGHVLRCETIRRDLATDPEGPERPENPEHPKNQEPPENPENQGDPDGPDDTHAASPGTDSPAPGADYALDTVLVVAAPPGPPTV